MALTPHLRPAQRAWAIDQYRVATAVLRELHRRGQRPVDLSLELGQDYDWMLRKLYGRASADLGEIFEWPLCVGVKVLPSLGAAGDVQPTPV